MNDRRNLILKKLLRIFAAIAMSGSFYLLITKLVLPFMDKFNLRKSTDVIGVLVGTFISYKLLKSITSMRKKVQERE